MPRGLAVVVSIMIPASPSAPRLRGIPLARPDAGPKTGTVTPDVAKAVEGIEGGKINFRVDKRANLHFVIGKASFDEKALAENYGAALDEILRAKPSSSKGRYLKKIVVSTTTGPGIPVDPAVTRNFAEA